MALNTIEYASKLQTGLDQKAVIDATSGWMDENAGQVIYTGGKSIKVPTISTTGLKDYDRDNGYPQGSVTLGYETLEMSMDRGTSFLLDAMDVDESNFMVSAANVTSEFQKDQVVPEIDAYRYSKLAAYAESENVVTYTPDEKDILKQLMYDIAAVKDIVGENVPLVAVMNSRVKAQLDLMDSFRKAVDVMDFKKGDVTLKVKSINECSLLPVPSSRMKDTYTFNDGKSSGEENGGFAAGVSAKQMNWIIVPRSVPIAVTKQDKMKIIDPDTYQGGDAWFLGYRRYHELWVKANKKNQIRVSKQA
ncbi:MAG: hypothetical protein MR392_08975 [Roseburia sp.]|nr:hypothetical protein [Roseburia sp.]DAU87745.1 MAG TPA: major capsid protein [Caudoviricetes sp.]